MTVTIAVDIAVGVGPLVLFRYMHRATECWQDGSVVAFDAHTNDDGTLMQMTARRQGANLIVVGSKAPRYVAPAHALPATHWNRAMLQGPMINTQSGELLQPTVTMVGSEQMAVGESSVLAQHFQLRGSVDLDTWYDATPSWVALRFAAKDGSIIRYERV